MKFITF